MPPDESLKPTPEKTVVIQDESLKQFEGGFTAIPNRVLRSNDLSLGARMTYAMLLHYAWQKDFCFPAQESLARDLGVTDRSIRTWLGELRDKNLITWQQRGLNRPNIYKILKLPGRVAPDIQSGPAKFSAPGWKATSGQERKQSSTYEDSMKKTHHVYVNKNKKELDADHTRRPTAELTGIGGLMAPRYSRLTADTAEHRIATAADDRTDDESKEDAYIADIMAQLGDSDARSRATYRRILRTLGLSLTLRLVGNARDALTDGVIQQQKMAPYFMGTVRNVCERDGIPLPFRTRQT